MKYIEFHSAVRNVLNSEGGPYGLNICAVLTELITVLSYLSTIVTDTAMLVPLYSQCSLYCFCQHMLNFQ
jgi:hypothetical protein